MLHFLGHLWGTKALHCMQNRAATISSSISSTHTILVLFQELLRVGKSKAY